MLSIEIKCHATNNLKKENLYTFMLPDGQENRCSTD